MKARRSISLQLLLKQGRIRLKVVFSTNILGLRNKREFKTQKITHKKGSINSEWKHSNRNLINKRGKYFQRIPGNQNQNEDLEEDTADYTNINKIKKGASKYSQNRVSRSTIINTNSKNTNESNNYGPFGKNKLEVHNRGDYHQNVKFTKDSHKFSKNGRSARDFSTGIERGGNQYSLTGGNEIKHAKKG